MSWDESEPSNQNIKTKAQNSYFDLLKKPIELYIFLDPLASDSWSFDSIIKKLSLEYGRFFTIRPILTEPLPDSSIDSRSLVRERKRKRYGLQCQTDPVMDPFASTVSLAIKAAELQGIKAGMRYLRKIQEYTFLFNKERLNEGDLIKCAEEALLDIDEFKNDLYSKSAKKALKCDIKFSKEMEIDQTPSIVFFNESAEDEGLKLTGLYSYDIYVKVLKEMLQKDVSPASKPKLEEFISYFKFIDSKELAVIYDWSVEKACKELKKLQLKQVVAAVPTKNSRYWQYIKSNE